MTTWPKARAIVALAAAYAVVLQAMVLAVGGPIVGNAGFAAASLCSHFSQAGSNSTFAGGGHGDGRGHGCPAACLACCCGSSVASVPTVARIGKRDPAQWVGVGAVIALVLPVRVAVSHRSRAPPVG